MPDVTPVSRKVLRGLLCFIPAAILSAGMTATIIGVMLWLHLHETLHRSSSQSQLRAVAQSALIYAKDHRKTLPEAVDFPDYAFQLATEGGLEDPRIWLSPGEDAPDGMLTVAIPDPHAPDRKIPHPALTQLRPQFSVVLSGLRLNQPPTTPIAWTRGLNPKTGKWGKDSPYRGKGGFIAFLDGRIDFVADLHAEGGTLRDFRTGKPTVRFHEALPPGARLSETAFSDQPETIWTRSRNAFRVAATAVLPFFFPVIALWGFCLLVYLAMLFEYAWNRQPFAIPRWIERALILTPLIGLTLAIVSWA